ncbi:helix-turn-helix domain-containing protein [Paractinoplanes lichenicola]|uniref:Helix-turn-helix domain-containing protein n=1 Tax=Paractinoplanes lichenicola TaxID=2802976 RepID=A0ABS1W113_9ACTN|nr:helix-turn-helix domain-containing protein [Actinoplanes lichenicola]MBL7260253.1 helix-turn-helix domain-containing protein [Actinoplanes lichenicola]
MNEFGATLRAWRDRMSPAVVGLPVSRNRRTKGLRREELAELSGISVDYLVRLEQGRFTTPSEQVAAALARALQLSAAERDHLYRLAGLNAPGAAEITDHIPPSVQRVVRRLDHAAVAVFAADWQLIWWNRGWAALCGDPSRVPPHLRNFARDTFLPGPAQLSAYGVTSLVAGAPQAALVADLRRATGRFPGSRRLTALIDELTTGSETFARLWVDGVVGAHRTDQKIIDHPLAGPVAVDCDVLTDGDADLKIVIMSAEPDSDDETKLRLAVLSGADAVPGT